MKRISFFILIISFAIQIQAQKKSAIGFSFNVTDFNTPAAIKSTSFNDVWESGDWTNLRDMAPGFSVYYFGGLAPKIDYSFRYNGTFGKSFTSVQPTLKDYYNELEASLHARLLKRSALLNPFISAGAGIGNYWKKNGVQAYIPVGVGLELNLINETYFFLQANYRHSLKTENVPNNLFYSFGFAQSLVQPKAPETKPLPPLPVVADKDNDGVDDAKDACPDVAGLPALNGCPDTDKDGIADKDDKCPTVAGTSRYDGCPVPDTDGDGINDENDKCPKIKGLDRYNGCPVPDTDGDGINDENDKCPTVAGVASNDGCPEIKKEVIEKVNYAAKNIYFMTASSQLQKISFKGLNEVVAILKDNPELTVDIEGYTDNSGDDQKNQILSEKRADAVKTYFESKGISASRLNSKGFGESNPVADNSTPAGRKQNRRVELKLRNH